MVLCTRSMVFSGCFRYVIKYTKSQHLHRSHCALWVLGLEYEPHREKTRFLPQISFAVTVKLINAFVFATRIVQFLILNPKFQASSLLL